MTPGVSALVERYDHFILDIYGVVHDGIRPFPGTIETLKKLKQTGKQTCLLSNSPRRASGVIADMEEMGIARALYDHVVTSGEATYTALADRNDEFHGSCGYNCWFIGTDEVAEILDGLNLTLTNGPEDASFILNSIPGTSPSAVVQMKKNFAVAIESDLPMICANPDLVVNVGDQRFECAGTFALMYEQMGGRVLYHGKPHRPVYERCLHMLGNPDKRKIVAIGDSLHTDIAGANGFGIDSAFNLAGIHREETGGDPRNTERLLASQPHRPTYVMTGFEW